MFDAYGRELNEDNCDVVWVSDLISGVGVASCDMLCEIVQPPSVTTVCQLFAQSIQTQYNTSGVSDGGRMYVVSLWSHSFY